MKLFLRYLSAAALVFLLTGCSKKDSGQGSNKDSLKFSFPNPPSEVNTEDGVVVGSLKAFNLEISSPDPIEISIYSHSGCEKTTNIGNEKIDNSNSAISIDLGNLEDGIYKFHYTITNSDSVTGSCTDSGFSYELDTSIDVLELSFATGITSPSNNSKPSFTVHGKIEEGAIVTLHDGSNCRGTLIPHTAKGDTITVLVALTAGTYNFFIKHTDSVGNVSCSANALPYVLNTAAPAALTLSFATGITSPSNNTTPSFVIGGVIESGATVTLHDGADCSGTLIPHTRTNNTITVSTALTTQKTYNFHIKHTNSAGNTSCSTNSLDYTMTIDAVALTLSFAAGTTSPSSDTTPSLVIGGVIESGATVTLHDGTSCSGTLIPHTANGTTITVSTALTANKTYNFRLKHTNSGGGTSCSAAALPYVLDTTAPAALTLSFSAAVKPIDNNTNPILNIGGTIEGGATVTLYDGGDCSGSPLPAVHNSGNIAVSTALTTNKTYNFRLKHTDSLGNASCSAAALPYVFDTTAPAALTLSLVTGLTSPSNDTTPSLVIGGTIENNATVTLHDGTGCSGASIPHTANSNTITVSPALTTQKIYSFRIKHTDQAGNVSCSAAALSYVLDTAAPTALSLSFAAGTTSPSNDTTPSLVIGGVIESGATVTLHDGADCSGASIPHTRTSNTIAVSTALTTNKTYNFRIKYATSAGNISCSTAALPYVLDTTAPAALTLGFSAAVKSTDNNANPILNIGGTIEGGATITLHDGADCSGSPLPTVRSARNIAVSTALTTNKTYNFRLKQADSAGNFSCSAAALPYVFDTTAPAALTLSLPTGITSPSNNTTPSLVIGGVIESGATVTLHDGADCSGASIPHTASGNTITVSTALTANNTYNFRIKHIDEAGNNTCSTNSLSYTINIDAVALTLSFAAGTTSPSKDNATPSLVIGGTIESGATVTLHNGNDCSGANVGHSRTNNNITVSTLTAGTYHFRIKHTDSDDNASCSAAALLYILDKAVETLTLSFATGTTSPSSNTTPSLVVGGVIENGATVSLHDGADCSGAETPNTRANSNISVSTLTTEKTYNFRVKHTDSAGNFSCSDALNYKLDTTSPVALTLGFDTGVTSPSNDTSPVLTVGGTVESGATVTLHDGGDCSGNPLPAGIHHTGKIAPVALTTNKTYNFRLKHTDEAGNFSCSAAALPYVFDTTAPAVLSLSLNESSPSNNTTPSLVIGGVIESGATVTLHDGADCSGSPLPAVHNSGNIAVSTALTTNKTYNFRVKHTDEVGNFSCSTVAQPYVLDTTAPTALTLSLVSGLTSPSKDNATPILTIGGTIENGGKVTLHDGADCSGAEIPHNFYSTSILVSTLTEGTYNFRLKHTDSAGNTSCSDAALPYELDTTAPAALTLSFVAGLTSPGHNTSPSLVVGGVIESSATVTLHDGSDCSGAEISHNLYSSIIFVSTLTDKTYNFRIKHTDEAGNASCSATSLDYELDTTAPAALTLSLPADEISPSNNINPLLIIGGTIEDGNTVTLHDGSDCSGDEIPYNEEIGPSVISVSLTTEKTYNFRIKHTDEAGNASCSANLDYELDTTGPVALSITLDGSSPSSDTTPTLVIDGTIEDGATVTLHDGADCSATNIDVGNPTANKKITVSTELTTNKTYSFWLKHTDEADNSTCSAAALSYVLDTIPPAALTLSLATGLTSPSNNTTPSLVIGGVIESDATVTLHDGADCSGAEVTNTRTNNDISLTALTTNKTYNFRIKHTDSVGHSTCSASALDYVLDTTDPVALTLNLATGLITPSNNTTPSLEIAGTIESGATITLHDGADCSGANVGHTRTNNDISVSPALTEDKTYNFRIKHTDSVGNASCSANALDYVLDTEVVTLTLSLAAGLNSLDNDTTPSLVIGGVIESGATITLHDGSDCSGADVAHTRTNNNISVSTLIAGNYNFRIKHTDSVGNASCSANAIPYVLDTTPPPALTLSFNTGTTSPSTNTTPSLVIGGTIENGGQVTLHDGSDCSGAEVTHTRTNNDISVSTLTDKTYNFRLKHTDSVGNASCSASALDYKLDTEIETLTLSLASGTVSPNNDTTPSLVIGGVIETGAAVTLHDGADCSSAEVTHTRTNNNITISTALTEGSYNFRIKHADEAGNVSCSATGVPYVLDTTDPVALTLSFNTGTTTPSNDATPSLVIGGVIEADSTITLHDGADCTGTAIPYTGTGTITVSTALTDGTYNFRIKHADEAGNVSCSASRFRL